ESGGTWRGNCLDRIESPEREKNAGDGPEHRQNCAFDKPLLCELATACAESGANGQLALTSERARELQIRSVGASDEKHTTDCSQKERDAVFVILHRGIEKDQRGDAASGVGIRVAAFEFSRDI